MFKVGDKVFHLQHGWGIVEEKQDDDILSVFDEYKVWNNSNNNLLSFTEYTLQGFTQERPVKLPEVGELCLVRDDDEDLWVLKCFMGYYPSLEKPFVTSPRNVYYKQLKLIKILD